MWISGQVVIGPVDGDPTLRGFGFLGPTPRGLKWKLRQGFRRHTGLIKWSRITKWEAGEVDRLWIAYAEFGSEEVALIPPSPRGEQDVRRLTAEAEKFLATATITTSWHRTPEDALASAFAMELFGKEMVERPKIVKAFYGSSLKNSGPGIAEYDGFPGIVGVGPSGIYWGMVEIDPRTGTGTQRASSVIGWDDLRDFAHSDGVFKCHHQKFVYDPDGAVGSHMADRTFRAELQQPEDAAKLAFLVTQLQAESLSDGEEGGRASGR
jgi:hypothetical protein